jgi:hypothetical protein
VLQTLINLDFHSITDVSLADLEEQLLGQVEGFGAEGAFSPKLPAQPCMCFLAMS